MERPAPVWNRYVLSRQKAAGRKGEKEDYIIKNPANSTDYLKQNDAENILRSKFRYTSRNTGLIPTGRIQNIRLCPQVKKRQAFHHGLPPDASAFRCTKRRPHPVFRDEFLQEQGLCASAALSPRPKPKDTAHLPFPARGTRSAAAPNVPLQDSAFSAARRVASPHEAGERVNPSGGVFSLKRECPGTARIAVRQKKEPEPCPTLLCDDAQDRSVRGDSESGWRPELRPYTALRPSPA